MADSHAPQPTPAADPGLKVVPRALKPPLRLSLKNRLLGRPLPSSDLAHERLGNATALAVFASDNLSSSAYATEEILRVLVPVVGVAAFSLVLPITIAMLVVLAFLILSYRQTIKAYPRSGGAYVVTKANFGDRAATVAGSALLIDYVLTVAVSAAAGATAVTAAIAPARPFVVEIAVGLVVVLAYGNLRGVRESAKIFAAPTYFFIANMVLLLAWGVSELVRGTLGEAELHPTGQLPLGEAGVGFLMGASLFRVLHAFASGGAAVTGVEAIADGVSAFKEPQAMNARKTLVAMGSILGVLFLGLSLLASHAHVVPFENSTEGTVLSQVGRVVYGGGSLGDVLFYALQLGTALILILAANTSFADFPRLANFAAEDAFLPRWLTKRGHRLVFSNGILALAVAAVVVVTLTGARVENLIPLYAVGVFTSFTLSQSSMTNHHWVERGQGWRAGLFVNGFGALLSFLVLLIVAITKFREGAWMILVAIPIVVLLLGRTHHAYLGEKGQLELELEETFRPPMPRHRVVVLVGKLDRATVGALQYARQLRPISTVALHVAIDPDRANALQEQWARVGIPITLEVVHAPHRDLVGAVDAYVQELVAQPGTEVTVLLPTRRYSRPWHRLLHDVDAGRLSKAMGRLPHVNLTLVPFHLGHGQRKLAPVAAPPE